MGCAENQQDRIFREGDMRVVELFITREYTEANLAADATWNASELSEARRSGD
jgi:hypothetical protein